MRKLVIALVIVSLALPVLEVEAARRAKRNAAGATRGTATAIRSMNNLKRQKALEGSTSRSFEQGVVSKIYALPPSSPGQISPLYGASTLGTDHPFDNTGSAINPFLTAGPFDSDATISVPFQTPSLEASLLDPLTPNPFNSINELSGSSSASAQLIMSLGLLNNINPSLLAKGGISLSGNSMSSGVSMAAVNALLGNSSSLSVQGMGSGSSTGGGPSDYIELLNRATAASNTGNNNVPPSRGWKIRSGKSGSFGTTNIYSDYSPTFGNPYSGYTTNPFSDSNDFANPSTGFGNPFSVGNVFP